MRSTSITRRAGAIWAAMAALAAASLGSKEPQAVPWSFHPVERPDPPAVKDAVWPRNDLDRFILARLEAAGLAPSPAADRRTLIRRVTLDLLGLPPSPEDVQAFVDDDRPDAYARLVDALLASPRHGERWARHWLDCVRFAETNGFEMNQPRPNAWPYRDYVIRALNEDRPFDRFVLDQLAGNVLGEDAATGFLVAGAWDQVKSPDVVLTLQQRMDELHDMVATAGSAFLGLTVGCARCHDHKFDPITQHDYYGIAAVFAGVEHGERELHEAPRPDRESRLEAARGELARVERQLEDLEPLAEPSAPAGSAPRRRAVDPARNVERFPPVTATRVRFTVLATTDAEPCIDELEVFTAGESPHNVALAQAGARVRSSSDLQGFAIHRLEHVQDGLYGNSRSWISGEAGKGRVEVELAQPERIDRVVWGRDREKKFKDRLATRYLVEVSLPEEAGGAWRVVASDADRAARGAETVAPAGPPAGTPELEQRRRTLEGELAKLSAKSMAYAGVFKEPGPTHVLRRGDPMQPLETVPPGAIAAVGQPLEVAADAKEGERRLALARWIASPRNPLAARVIANRVWLHHFGEGIVATPSDFGNRGAAPSHPALLDWLASELVDHGWSLKQLHRWIVTSATYCQSSRPDPKALAVDAGSRLLWRYPPRRLEAEAIRDAVLAVSGKLDLTAGGPGFSAFRPNDNYVRVYEPKDSFGPGDWRRMVYMTKVRMRDDATFGPFDCPDGGQACPKRSRSTTPLQALSLLNSSFVVEQAGFFAERARRESSGAEGDLAAAVRRAFLLALGRAPDDGEAREASIVAREHGLETVCRALLNSSEMVFVP